MKLDKVVFLSLLCYLLLLSATYIFKIKILVVTSNSMTPTFKFGDVLLAVSQEHYQPGDIISFSSEESIVTHRVVAIHKKEAMAHFEYQTKGDANVSADSRFVLSTQVLGKVKSIIPKIGYFILLFQSKLAVVFLVFVSLSSLTYKMCTEKIKKNAE